jgi:beta-glucosidase
MTDEAALTHLLARLTLAEKVTLVSGASFWSTAAIPSIGLRSMVLSDGPSGVRGAVWDERSPSLSMPSGTALASSWDADTAYRYGEVAAGEARRKGVDVVLGPTINLHRSPLGGRHFEAFSEDPLLSGVLAAAYVRGLQDNGVAATPKHYVANDSETDRFTVDVRVDERVLRELYLLPFELAVEARPWALMASYNAVAGVTMTENVLLTTPLREEWGFDGAVVSDWTAVRSVHAATAGIDLAMPGPVTAWSSTLEDAVRDGRVSEEALDRKVVAILRLAQRVGALDGTTPRVPASVDLTAFARDVAADGTVLLENHDELPWQPADIRSIAVIGQHARLPRIQGGGSATVIPSRVVSPLDGIRDALPGAALRYEVGAVLQSGIEEFDVGHLTNPRTGEPGLRVTFLDEAGAEIFGDDRRMSSLVWVEGDAPLDKTWTIVLETTFHPDNDDDIHIGFASSKHGRILVDGVVVVDEQLPVDGDDVGLTLLSPPSVAVPVHTRAGVAIRLRAEFDVRAHDPLPSAASVTLGFARAPEDPADLIARAVDAARSADVAVVVVGTTAESESEGMDRVSLDLPGRQDDLVRAVVAANPRTVVVVNAGAPVLLPWRADAAAVLLGYFGGQEMGAAIAAVLVGELEPGGRLTTTWPAESADVPVMGVTPSAGVLDYAEGLDIGYRAWLASPHEPAYAFGSGLGYTTWQLGAAEVEGPLADDSPTVTVAVTNTGERPGKQVVQVYAERADSALERPARWLVGFSVVRLPAGGSTMLSIPLRSRSFAHWDSREGWAIEPGEFALRIGTSVTDLPVSAQIATSRVGARQ